MFDHRRKRLSPVLADEPLVGQGIKRRVRVVLLAVVVAFALTNASSYLIGQAVRADVDRDNRARVDRLEREFAADLEERRRRRDAELRQLRRDACTLADRIRPRDEELDRLRRRYQCAGTEVTPAAPTPPDGSTPSPARPSRAPAPASTSRASAPAPSPARPPAAPSPSPSGGVMLCLPVVGCPLQAAGSA